MTTAIRHLVVDNEAASALLSQAAHDPKRAEVVLAIMAANGRCIAPTAVRCEAGWMRSDPASANANRLIPEDDPLDRLGADRNVELRRSVPSASLVDAAVAMTAERIAGPEATVEVLTSDVGDLTALASYLAATVVVRPI